MAAEIGSGMMVLATVSLVIPAIYASVTHHREPEHFEAISLDISYVLIVTYVASLIFQLVTHQRLFAPAEHAADGRHEEQAAGAWTVRRSLVVLLAAAVLVGFVSEFLVGAIHAAGEALGLGKVFMGVIVVAVIGNAAEHSTAVLMAAKQQDGPRLRHRHGLVACRSRCSWRRCW